MNPSHPMSKFSADHAVQFIALIIWKLRAHCPNLEVRLSASDMKDFKRAFLIQTPVVAAIGDPDGITLRLLDQEGGKLHLQRADANADHPAAQEMERMLKARADAPGIATALALALGAEGQMGALSSAQGEMLVQQAIEALMLLSGPHDHD